MGWLKVPDKIPQEKYSASLRTYSHPLLSTANLVHECSFKLILGKFLRLAAKLFASLLLSGEEVGLMEPVGR